MPPYLDYDINSDQIDLGILDRADIYIFTEFNEYTYAICEVIQSRLDNREIYF